MSIIKEANVVWRGEGKTGKGEVTTESKVLDKAPYGFQTRFEGVKGTNPEELIGAAHASCFSMALAFKLGDAGFHPKDIQTTAKVSLDKDGAGFSISSIKLSLKANVPEITEAKFQELANDAKQNCPVSKALKVPISLEASLI